MKNVQTMQLATPSANCNFEQSKLRVGKHRWFRWTVHNLRALGSIALCTTCCMVIFAGLFVLLEYETTPGEIGKVAQTWPQESKLQLDSKHPTLVLFAHPRCPCTRATIGELALLMTRSSGKVATHVFFFKPADAPTDWPQTDLWHAAERIPGVTVYTDPDGNIAKEFGAATSGHTSLYGMDGQLLFHGGITSSRGHAGSNVGRSAIESILFGETSDHVESFVYGCPLLNTTSQQTE